MGVRIKAPGLWRGNVNFCREIGIDWPEVDIAAVTAKVRASDPDSLPDNIARVLEWCREAERQHDEDALAHVSLWRMSLPIEIFVGPDGEITYRLEPDTEIEVDQ